MHVKFERVLVNSVPKKTLLTVSNSSQWCNGIAFPAFFYPGHVHGWGAHLQCGTDFSDVVDKVKGDCRE